LRTITKFIAIMALAAPLLSAGQALAATYKLPIKGGGDILKIFLDNGVARRAGTADGAVVFEVEMEANQCVANLRIAFSINAPTIPVNGYDVCGEKGFGLTTRMVRH
jgi:hypothetical protein